MGEWIKLPSKTLNSEVNEKKLLILLISRFVSAEALILPPLFQYLEWVTDAPLSIRSWTSRPLCTLLSRRTSLINVGLTIFSIVQLLDPHPSVVATKLLSRKELQDYGKQFNMLAASWINFMIHDWIDHLEDTEQMVCHKSFYMHFVVWYTLYLSLSVVSDALNIT